MPLRTLLIDNYDSYTYNLYQLIAEVNAEPPQVVHNDELTWDQLQELVQHKKFDNVVISPGPGSPAHQQDVGVCLPLVKHGVGVPVLGVCLGMQAMAIAHGAAVVHAPEPIHGRVSHVEHSGHQIFSGIPSGSYSVVRYHSLVVEERTLPPCLEAVAWTSGRPEALPTRCAGRQSVTVQCEAAAESAAPLSSCASAAHDTTRAGPRGDERLLMGIVHRQLPLYGVQFHPESIGTSYGRRLLANFRDLTYARQGRSAEQAPGDGAPSNGPFADGVLAPTGQPHVGAAASLDVQWRLLTGMLAKLGGSQALFELLYGATSAADTFWLDSSATDRGRFSYMGGRGGPLWQRVIFCLAPPQAAASNEAAVPAAATCSQAGPPAGCVTVEDAHGQVRHIATHFFAYLQERLARHTCLLSAEAASQLPFDFWGGYVGYLGYELKAECGGQARHASPTPDAALFLADRIVAVDHHSSDVYLMSMYGADSAEQMAAAESWLLATQQRLEAHVSVGAAAREQASVSSAPPASSQGCAAECRSNGGSSSIQNGDSKHHLVDIAVDSSSGRRPQDHVAQQCKQTSSASQLKPKSAAKVKPGDAVPPFRLLRPRQRYEADIAACLQALRDGESYEVCLTTALVRPQAPDPFTFYQTLRSLNPAPYAAWLSFGSNGPQVCCSSPERFLCGRRGGGVEARPIKGTAPRSPDPHQDAARSQALAASEKDRAENLMIVDLLRNDLGRVCQVGSVHVPDLMEVESFATVHQLVSTVRGQRRPDASVVDCLRAAFPGGSMTGAPKIRTMDIIDRLENGARGVYSGSVGFIGFNDTFDMNIVIRTAIFCNGEMRIGAGGAIVAQSDIAGEYDEMRLKAKALLHAVGICDAGAPTGQLISLAQVDDRTPYSLCR